MRNAATGKNEQKKTLPAKKAGRGKTQKVRLKVKARPGCVVCIAGTFNQWNPLANRMTPEGDGFYVADLELPAGRHEYKFLIDGVWHLDPACPHCIPNAFGSQNHVVEVC
ncbi:MAG: glycogen-binding domain-containing protein [Kiritimatiellae bacterium]|nr:glycogen-binding domain-containing protein [Kiritimatiellia bacterium]